MKARLSNVTSKCCVERIKTIAVTLYYTQDNTVMVKVRTAVVLYLAGSVLTVQIKYELSSILVAGGFCRTVHLGCFNSSFLDNPPMSVRDLQGNNNDSAKREL